MNLPNLDLLIRTLRTVQATGNEQRFNMEAWFAPADRSGDASLHGLEEVDCLEEVPVHEAVADPTSCGTAACLAGWCQLIGARTEFDRWEPAVRFGRLWLGLNDVDAVALFLGHWSDKHLWEITLEDALAHLEILRFAHGGAPAAETPEREPALT